MIRCPVSESSWPVGSSASRSFGRLARARAMATRCCSPPDSSCGRCLARSARPTCSRSSSTRRPRSPGSVRTRRSGTSTFSAADRTGIRPKAWKMNAIFVRRTSTRRVLVHRGQLLAVEEDLARRRPVQAAEQVEQGRLAAARAAADGEQARPRSTARSTPRSAWIVGVARRVLARRRARRSVSDHRHAVDVSGRHRSPAVPRRAVAASAVRPDPDVVVLEPRPDAIGQPERLDVGARQLQPAGLVEHGELLVRRRGARRRRRARSGGPSRCSSGRRGWPRSARPGRTRAGRG